jgi:signal transduction histidine kinase
MFRRLFQLPLYIRIWLAVVLSMAALTLIAGWILRMTAEPPMREVVVRNMDGEIVGRGQARFRQPDGLPIEGPAPQPPGMLQPPGHFGLGPEFLVTMQDGSVIHIHLPRSPHSFWTRPPFGFFWTLGLVGLAVALATYPIVRRLTRHLEDLQKGVEQWGTGNLSVRVPVNGSDEVAYLAERFNLAASRIEELVNSHKTLLANASHELRSPLTRIRMGLELMGEHNTPTLKTEISRSVAELDSLIDEILLASRLDSKDIDVGTIEDIDMTGLASEECARAGVDLELGADPQCLHVDGVAKLLRRVLRNLLENAKRYGQNDLSLTLLTTGNSEIELRVCDRGPGVPAQFRESIFEPFFRLPGASEKEGGVGLGLALVRSIVLRHQGRVYCEDRAGGGACFVVVLPRGVQSPAANAPLLA